MTDHDLAQARQAIEGLLTDRVLLQAYQDATRGSWPPPKVQDAVVSAMAAMRAVLADALAPAWAEMQRAGIKAECDAAMWKKSAEAKQRLLAEAEARAAQAEQERDAEAVARLEMEACLNNEQARTMAAEAERDALRRVIADVRAAGADRGGRAINTPELWVALDRLLAAETGGSLPPVPSSGSGEGPSQEPKP
jgi:hypothetical protein